MTFLAPSHTPHLLLILSSCTSSEAIPCRQLYTVSQTSAARFLSVWQGKEVEWKNVPHPLRPHGKGGEQSVRSPPATVGHICGQLSLCCSLRRCTARPASALCRSLPALCLTISHTLKSKNWSKEQPEKIHFSPHSLCPPVLPFPDYLY